MSEQDPGINAQLELLQRIGVRGFFMTEAYTCVLEGYTPGQYIFGFNPPPKKQRLYRLIRL